MGRLAAGTTVTLLEGIIVMVAPGLTLLTEPPPLPTGLLVVTRVGLWLVGTDGILKIFHNHSLSLSPNIFSSSPDLTHRNSGSLGGEVHGGHLCWGRGGRGVCRILF